MKRPKVRQKDSLIQIEKNNAVDVQKMSLSSKWYFFVLMRARVEILVWELPVLTDVRQSTSSLYRQISFQSLK
jgi:hypothetical protein